MSDSYQLQKQTNDRLNKAVVAFRERGEELASCEKNYRIELSKKLLLLQQNKIPMGIIDNIAKGDEEIAELRFQRDVARVLYASAKEAIYTFRQQLKIARAEVSEDRNGYGDD